MKIDSEFRSLWGQIRKLTNEVVPFTSEFGVTAYRDIDVELEDGLEIHLSDLDNTSGLTTYKGRQVLLYIPDQGREIEEVIAGRKDGRKFHIAHCVTLEAMKADNRFERYVATTDLSGLFKVQGRNVVGSNVEGSANLRVCINCLKKLNYMNAQQLRSGERRTIAQEFSIGTFFETYSSCFKYMPKRFRVSEGQSNYADGWQEISRRTRDSASYTCKSCKVDLTKHPDLCHVHHVDGVKGNNSPSNLVVLCAACHRLQPKHEHLFVSHQDMRRITELRRVQGLNVRDWEAALMLADRALYGVLCLIRSKNFDAPELGYPVKVASGDRLVLDAAWPAKKLAVVIVPEKLAVISGWRVLGIESALSEFGEL